MEVILLQKIKNFGKRGDVKKVADGYARNFLFPQNLAEIATPKAILAIKREMQTTEVRENKIEKAKRRMAHELQGTELSFSIKANDAGIFYGAVNSVKIAEMLALRGFDIKPSQITLSSPIKAPGRHSAKVNLGNNKSAVLKMVIGALA